MTVNIGTRPEVASPETGCRERADGYRRFALVTASAGVVGVATLGLIRNADVRQWVAGLAMGLLAVGVASGTWWARGTTPRRRVSSPTLHRSAPRWSLAVGLGPVVLAAAAAQSWFTWGRSLAGGDIAPPEGTAWLAHLFSPWAWSGSNLGGPNANATQLPWAVILGVTHELGLPAWFAQRLWLTFLFAAAAAAAVLLLRTLGLRPVPSSAGALVYLINSYVLSTVGISAVYLAAMVVLAAYPALVLAAAKGRISILTASIALASLAPLLGFVYLNPPLAAMVAGTAVLAAPVSGQLWGRAAARRAFGAIALGGLAALLVSAYWIVPSLLQIAVLATGALSRVNAWAWTEGRANLANGLWLNTTWGWAYSIYYPYAGAYGRWPLQIVKFLLPACSFAGLALALAKQSVPGASHLLRLALGSAAVGLLLILLGTGTNLPGSVLFDPLYALPFGWLLREPGRFLMIVGLCYAVLIGVAVQIGAPALVTRLARSSMGRAAQVWNRRSARLAAAALVTVALGVALAPAYPLATGQVAPAQRRGAFPSSRVAFPYYWTSMAAYLNSTAPPGHLLVLPPDDFYQMPYTWGYYGNDGFITDLLSRDVLDPTAQGYLSVATQLTTTDDNLAAALMTEQWLLANRLIDALGTPLLLVRGDVNASFPGRNIISPQVLQARLLADPYMRLIHRSGPLALFRDTVAGRVATTITSRIVTVNSASPDLRALLALPAGSALVTEPMQRGLPAVIEAPRLSSWSLVHGRLQTSIHAPPGWSYHLLFLFETSGGKAAVPISASLGRGTDSLRLPLGPQEVVDGSFQSGPWQPTVGNCNDFGGRSAGHALSATVVRGPAGRLALRLQASTGSACEATPVRWNGGTFLLSLWVRHLGGATPRLCLWESALRRCSAQTPTLASSSSWVHVQDVVSPNPAAGTLSLFAYADVLLPGQTTTNEYAGVTAYRLPAAGRAVLLATPRNPRSAVSRLQISDSSFSPSWVVPRGRHVLVDGLRNGWVLPTSRHSPVAPSFIPAAWDRGAQLVSATAAVILVALAMLLFVQATRRKLTGAKTGNGIRS